MRLREQADDWVQDVAAAAGLLTRLPVPVGAARAQARGAAVAWSYPLVGLGVGAVLAAVASLALAMGLTPQSAALAGITATVLLTGALHEDGLADTADGIGGGWTRERRLEIMRDSRIGAFGVLALILAVGLRAALVSDLLDAGAIWAAALAAAMLSRTAMVGVWAALPPARADGLSVRIGRPGLPVTLAAGALCLPLLAMLTPWVFAVAALAAAVTAAALGRKAQTALGGQTGDVLGAVQQVTEIAVLAVLAALLT